MKIFVAYPFKLEGYRDELASHLSAPEYELLYADSLIANKHILHKIQGMLSDSDLIIFDLTGVNPNVTLELGIAITADHPYVIVVQNEAAKEINADVSGWDHLRYETVPELSQKLRTSIESGAIETRATRRDANTPNESPLGPKPYPAVWLTPEAQNTEPIFGLHILPERWNRKRHLLVPEDDAAMVGAELRSRGMTSSLHSKLKQEVKDDGYLFSSPPTGVKRGDGAMERPHEMISVDSDGEITIRFRQNDEGLLFQYLVLLATGYMLAQDTFQIFAVPPKAKFRAIIRLDSRADGAQPKVPRNFDETAYVNPKNQSFADAFYEITMRFFRAARTTAKREDVEVLLRDFERNNVSLMHRSNR